MHLHRHFHEYGISLSGSVIQTDNGPEFTAPWNSRKVTACTQVVEKGMGATHHLIPPGAKTYQSDVESFHRLVEEDLYAVESFGSEKEFLRKAALYQAKFNCTRKNSYKGDTPLNLVRETYPGLPVEALVCIPVILDNLLVQYKDELTQYHSHTYFEQTACRKIHCRFPTPDIPKLFKGNGSSLIGCATSNDDAKFPAKAPYRYSWSHRKDQQ